MKRWSGFIIIVIIVTALIILNQTVLDLSPERICNWILSVGVLAPILYVALYTFRPFILFPTSVLSLAGGLAFGPLYGTLLTMTGATAGAVLAFMFAKKAWRRSLEKGERGCSTSLSTMGFWLSYSSDLCRSLTLT